MSEPDRLEGRIVNVCDRQYDCEDDDDDDGDEDCDQDKDGEGMCWGRLSGRDHRDQSRAPGHRRHGHLDPLVRLRLGQGPP